MKKMGICEVCNDFKNLIKDRTCDECLEKKMKKKCEICGCEVINSFCNNKNCPTNGGDL